MSTTAEAPVYEVGHVYEVAPGDLRIGTNVRKDTRPEIAVRKMLWALGYRYRLHPNDVPGRPDIVFKALRKAIFVHGCFWHRHVVCLRTRTPKTRVRFWSKKFEENVARDKSTRARLARSGWRVLVIWECMSEKSTWLQAKLTTFLGERS